LKQTANDLDFSEIEGREEAVKSFSWSSTFKENTNDPIKIAGYLETFAECVHKSLIKLRFL
jgi:DNA polymerase IV (DinB-like DNA polymerase)